MRIPQDTAFVYDESGGKVDPFLMYQQLLGDAVLSAHPRRWVSEESERGFEFLPPISHAERLLRVNYQNFCIALNKLLICILELSQLPIAYRSPISQ